MPKIKYVYNPKALSYEKLHIKWSDRFLRALWFLLTGLVFASVTIFIAYKYFDSPKEKQLKREIEQLTLQFDILNRRTEQISQVLEDLQDRDDNLYRVVFETEPIPNEIRKAGFGGVDRYRSLLNYDNGKLMVEVTKKINKISKQMYIQSTSFDEVFKLAKSKELMLQAIPAIQPIENKKLKHMASGYGWRMHPIYKIQLFHSGMDFSAPTGTEIHATGNGTVMRADAGERGYGLHVLVNHGFGYQTLYGHMSKVAVKPGQKVNRGDLLGYVGSTGVSTAPHLHYEVIKGGNKVNPINYYYNDLTPEEYDAMLEQSSQPTQSFD
ncbi:MAG: M23 family metallopeptidase [Bacteroidia bacterium]|nr:M23 family metallopeptidase [Bacteroidia bacterium]